MWTSGKPVEFGRYRLVPAQRLLVDGDVPVPLGGRAFDLLVALIERRPVVVSKAELMRQVWGGQVVEENTLAVHLSALRKALGGGKASARYIATVRNRGYKFLIPANVLDEAPETASPLPSGSLPRADALLIGRDGELAQIMAAIRSSVLVTLTGPGGIGKSRLALAVGEQLAQGSTLAVSWVDLASVQNVALVAGTVARTLGLELGSGSVLPQLTGQLRGQHRLLILDNCERVAAGVAELAVALREVGGVRLLATSQEPLGVSGEQVQRIEPLAVPEATATPGQALQAPAVQLFVARARARYRDFPLDERNVSVVVGLCRRLEGVPLALELVAARAALLGVEPVARRIDDHLLELSWGRRDAPAKHQTLRALLAWSYGLLTTDEQLALRRLAVFAGGYTLEAAEAIVADATVQEWRVAELMASLIAKSLVMARRTVHGARYWLLDMTHLYARERLVEAGEMTAVMQRHAEYLCRLFHLADLPLERVSEDKWAAQCMPELDNLRTTLDWCFGSGNATAIGVTLTGMSLELLKKLGQEGRRRVEIAVAHLDDSTPADIASAIWLGRHWVAALNSDFDGMVRAAEHALHFARASRNSLRILRAGMATVWALTYSQRWSEVTALLEELKQICDHGEYTLGSINVESELARRYVLKGQLDVAIGSLDRARQLAANRNDDLTSALIASDYALYYSNIGDYVAAAEEMREGWQLASKVAEADLANICCNFLIALYIISDQVPRVRDVLESMDIASLMSIQHLSRELSCIALATACGEYEIAAMISGYLLQNCEILQKPRYLSSVIYQNLETSLRGQDSPRLGSSIEYGKRLSENDMEGLLKTVPALFMALPTLSSTILKNAANPDSAQR